MAEGEYYMKIMSIDAETNGLWGEAFTIAATLHEHWEGTEIKYFKSLLERDFV